MTIQVPCPWYPEAVHEYPDDWVFGGADGKHPGADPRFESTSYTYYDGDLNVLWVTSSPICDDEALDEFTWVASLGDRWNPVWISARRADGTTETLKFTYDKATDTVTPRG